MDGIKWKGLFCAFTSLPIIIPISLCAISSLFFSQIFRMFGAIRCMEHGIWNNIANCMNGNAWNLYYTHSVKWWQIIFIWCLKTEIGKWERNWQDIENQMESQMFGFSFTIYFCAFFFLLDFFFTLNLHNDRFETHVNCRYVLCTRNNVRVHSLRFVVS